MKIIKFILPFFTIAFFSAAMAQTPRINFFAAQVYPEGTAYYPAGNVFFVSSVTTGTIGKVDANGNYSIFYEDHSLKSSYGMKVDAARNKLWICTGDANYSIYSDPSTYKKLIRVISLNLSTGQIIDDVDLSNLYSGKHFANDLTVDNAGNVYITDSYSPVIYKISTQIQASIFSQSDYFKSIDIGLNGIVWHPGGFLIVAHSTNGELYKVPLNNPNQVDKIEALTFFPGVDGLLLNDQGSLLLVQNKGVNKVYHLRSETNWATVKVTAGTLLVDRLDNPTTLTKKGNQIFVLNAKLNELSDHTDPPSKYFSLQQVRFVSMQ